MAAPVALSAQRDDTLSREVHFQISAQPLALALIEFSDQTRIQVISSGSAVANVRTPGVRGRHRIVDALQVILQDTGLKYLLIKQDTISISASSWRTIAAEGAGVLQVIAQAQTRDSDPVVQVARDDALEAIETTATRIIHDGVVDAVVLVVTVRSCFQLPAFFRRDEDPSLDIG